MSSVMNAFERKKWIKLAENGDKRYSISPIKAPFSRGISERNCLAQK
jgi:hypothetical protein